MTCLSFFLVKEQVEIRRNNVKWTILPRYVMPMVTSKNHRWNNLILIHEHCKIQGDVYPAKAGWVNTQEGWVSMTGIYSQNCV